MTEFEQQLIENLTKQLDAHNKLEYKKMQDKSLWENNLQNAEIDFYKARTKFFYNAADLLGVIATIIVIISILVGIGILSSLGSCSSFF